MIHFPFAYARHIDDEAQFISRFDDCSLGLGPCGCGVPATPNIRGVGIGVGVDKGIGIVCVWFGTDLSALNETVS